MTIFTLVFVFLVANTFETLAAPAATYNQQQTGELNVQVHLKDIQVVAIVDPADMFGFEDEYVSYDYTDFTIKPSKPQTTPSASAGTAASPTSVKPWNTWPTLSPAPSTSNVVAVPAEGENLPSVAAPAEQAAVDSKPQSESENAEDKPEKNTSPSSSSAAVADDTPTAIIINTSTDDKTPSASPAEPQSIPTTETIRVIVKTGLASEKEPIADVPALVQPETSSSEENAGTVAAVQENSEVSAEPEQSQPLEKKCSPGYARDQNGRCSRVHGRRRFPASLLPFGIRLAPRIQRHRDHQQETVEN